MRRVLLSLLLLMPCAAWPADAQRLSFLEQEVRNLQRQVQSLSRQLDELRTRPDRPATSPASAADAPVAASDGWTQLLVPYELLATAAKLGGPGAHLRAASAIAKWLER